MLKFYAGTLANPTDDPSIPPSVGIYRFEMDPETGSLQNCGLAARANGPSWVTKYPTLPGIWYAAASSETKSSQNEDVVLALRQEADGTLSRIGAYPTGGTDACHISASSDGKFLFVSNYRNATLAFFEVQPDGSLGGRQTFQLEGRGPNPVRQAKSYAHFMKTDPTGKFLLACNLGADRIHSFRFFEAENRWKQAPDFPYAQSASGSGPRHLVFSPDGRWVYVINELSCTLDTFAWDPEIGSLTLVTSVPTPPPRFHGLNKGAAIALSKDGKFLYVTNRGADLITVFQVDTAPVDGSRMEAGVVLDPVQFIPSGGEFPRFGGLDPSGNFFLAANKKSHNITVFRVDPTNGTLSRGSSAAIAWCTCIEFSD